LIYITIPVHDEARTLGVLLWKIRKVMAGFERDYEILVYDDASGDTTTDVLERYALRLPVRVLRSEVRVGYRKALEGLLRDVVERSPYPKRDVVVTIQGDFTENPEDLVPMVKAIEGGADLVAGTPTEETGPHLPAPMRWSRRLAPHVLGPAFRTAPVSDPLTGFRAYRVVVLKKAIRDLEDGESLLTREGWGANVELLARVAPHARRIEESPIRLEFGDRERPSRFRWRQQLGALFSLRGSRWPAAV